MADQKFDWDVTLDEFGVDIKFNTKTLTFGDGYDQDVSFGINNDKTDWSWAIIDSQTVINEIQDFLVATKGSETFLWDSPRGEVRVKVSDLRVVPLGGVLWKISATFSQRYR